MIYRTDPLFREAKLRAVQEGVTLKRLLTDCIRSGLRTPSAVDLSARNRRQPPPIAICRSGEKRKGRALSTHPKVLSRPLSPQEAWDVYQRYREEGQVGFLEDSLEIAVWYHLMPIFAGSEICRFCI